MSTRPERLAYLGDNVGTIGSGSSGSGSSAATGFTNHWLESRSNTHLFDERYGDFPLYSEPRKSTSVYSEPYNTTYRTIVSSLTERTPVSDAYFSHKNMKHLKWLICETVRKRSGGLYNLDPAAQSDTSLLEVMRSMYINYAKHLPDKIAEQVGELNYMVLTDMVPRIMSGIQLNLAYRRDKSQQPLPLDRPQCVSAAGTRVNRSVTTTFI